MMDYAKKGFYIGLGLAGMTKEKIEELGREFAKRSQLSEDEGRKLAEFLKDESKKAHADLKENVDRLVQKAIARLPCEKKVAQLEARLAALEAKLGITPASDPGDKDAKTCGCDK